jgi:hypothetical protein
MATSATGDSEVGDRSSPAEAMQGDWVLTMEPVQAIIPVSKMLQTGYNMMWTKDECVVENAEHQRLYQSPWSKNARR